VTGGIEPRFVEVDLGLDLDRWVVVQILSDGHEVVDIVVYVRPGLAPDELREALTWVHERLRRFETAGAEPDGWKWHDWAWQLTGKRVVLPPI
jgi:hypothetical protein